MNLLLRVNEKIFVPLASSRQTRERYLDFCWRWRLPIGLNAVPDGVALYFRLTLCKLPFYHGH